MNDLENILLESNSHDEEEDNDDDYDEMDNGIEDYDPLVNTRKNYRRRNYYPLWKKRNQGVGNDVRYSTYLREKRQKRR